MPVIRPSSDLRNNYNEISAFCHQYSDPVFLTKNGVGDLVVLSIDAYEKLVGKYELYALLVKSERDLAQGKVKDASQVFAELEADL